MYTAAKSIRPTAVREAVNRLCGLKPVMLTLAEASQNGLQRKLREITPRFYA